jgi:glycosyltransferase involved in cell wall biosynthesis
VALPGTDRYAPVRESRNGALSLLAVGSLVPRKGYDVLLAALALIADLSWHLTIVGDRERSPETARRLSEQIAALNLDRRVTQAGAASPQRLGEFYANADLFVLASRFEGYGMAFAEALAHGLPVIGTMAGAIPETVPREAGILVAPDDIEALATALRTVIIDRGERTRLAAGASAAATRLPTWQDTARIFHRVILALAGA